MSALYAMRYVGQGGLGLGAVYVGRGKIVGVDASNGRYEGAYSEQGGRLNGTVVLTAPPGGATLVTGVQLPAGQKVSFTFDWPPTFGNGQPQQLSVAGRTVTVTFEKVGDIP